MFCVVLCCFFCLSLCCYGRALTIQFFSFFYRFIILTIESGHIGLRYDATFAVHVVNHLIFFDGLYFEKPLDLLFTFLVQKKAPNKEIADFKEDVLINGSSLDKIRLDDTALASDPSYLLHRLKEALPNAVNPKILSFPFDSTGRGTLGTIRQKMYLPKLEKIRNLRAAAGTQQLDV